MMKKRTVLRKLLLGAVLVFGLLNITWYFLRAAKYHGYSAGMDASPLSTFFTPQYSSTDDESFTSSVYHPGYLHLHGNLFVGSPCTDAEHPYTDSLIVWPLLTGGYEYGVLLYDGGIQYQIYIDETGAAIHEDDQAIVSNYAQQIAALLEKANARRALH